MNDDGGHELDPAEAVERLQAARDRFDDLEPEGTIRCGLCEADGRPDRAVIEVGDAHPFDAWEEHVHEVHEEGPA